MMLDEAEQMPIAHVEYCISTAVSPSVKVGWTMDGWV